MSDPDDLTVVPNAEDKELYITLGTLDGRSWDYEVEIGPVGLSSSGYSTPQEALAAALETAERGTI